VWSRPEVAGYDELVDVTEVEKFVVPSRQRVVDLAAMAAATDPTQGRAKFAIVASQDIAFGLGRMFAVHRSLEPRSTKQLEAFRRLSEALVFLRVKGMLEARLDEPE